MIKNIKPVRLRNIWNNEEFICDDFQNVRTVDGNDFVEVHKENSPRKFWINKAPLVRSKEKVQKKT